MMAQSGWRKARHSQYKHLYDNGVARCVVDAAGLPEFQDAPGTVTAIFIRRRKKAA